MANIRVYELAKQLGLDNKVVKEILKDNGIEVKSHMSSISDEAVEIVKKSLKNKNEKNEKREEKVEKADNKPQENKQEKPVNNVKPEKTEKKQNGDNSDNKPKKSHITQVYNPQNSGVKNDFRKNKDQGRGFNKNSNGSNNKRDFNSRDNSQGRDNRDNRDNRDRNQGRDGRGNRDGFDRNQGRDNRDNRDRNQGRDNRDNRDRNQGRDGRDNRDNRDNRRNGQRNSFQGRDNDRGNNFRNDSKNESISEVMNGKNDRRKNRMAEENKKKSKSDYDEIRDSKFEKNQQNLMKKPQSKKEKEKDVEEIKEITLPESLTVKELADKLKIQPSALVKKLFLQGQIVTINQEIDFELAQNICLEYNVIAEEEEKVDIIEELLKEEEEDETKLQKRPPVVCVMGHVDHGKTSLLDAIRQTNVIAKEAGGITQHIGAYTVESNGEQITFLDTPGHEAFTAMRMRGAQSTDIAILVVAADDGVMPQTVEAINHAKAAGITIIVAINKIDKPSANVDRVKQELAEYELIPEEWGGDTIFVPVSAHTKEGIDDLLENILLVADVMELKANPDRKARGLVIEARLDKGRGPVATILVQKGTLKVGDNIAAGSFYGKVRAMIDDKHVRKDEATPSTPVEILGLNGVPNAGEVIVSTENEKEARNFAETFIKDGREKLLEGSKAKQRMSLDDLFSQIKEGELKELDIIVKADVQGSVEAVKNSLVKLSNDEVVVKVIHSGVGAINESDVILASASNAIIIGFNVRPDNMAKEISDREKVDLRLYRVIYQAIADVEAAMKGLLDPVFEEKVIGHAEIRQIFKASGVGNIAGSYVLDGKFERGCMCRITREGSQIFEGNLSSLKRFKDDVKEVKAGYECGLVFEGFSDIAELDIVEAYKMVEVPR
ncbi:translation initiation factor IF-2 [Lachnospiraceae bacterium RM5]|nr:translation initiation factor IF-2 [Lachnospiraceae bacterium RM5]